MPQKRPQLLFRFMLLVGAFIAFFIGSYIAIRAGVPPVIVIVGCFGLGIVGGMIAGNKLS